MAINAYLFGNWKTDDPSKLILLSVQGVTTGNFQTLSRMDVAYQVTTGKTLYIYGVTLIASAAGNRLDEIGYGDIAVANSASLPTNPVRFHIRIYLPINTPTFVPLGLAIPATKYPYSGFITNEVSQIYYCEEKP